MKIQPIFRRIYQPTFLSTPSANPKPMVPPQPENIPGDIFTKNIVKTPEIAFGKY